MELPSTRELELEVLLRQRETQLAELKVGANNYISKFCGSEEQITFFCISRMKPSLYGGTSLNSQAHRRPN